MAPIMSGVCSGYLKRRLNLDLPLRRRRFCHLGKEETWKGAVSSPSARRTSRRSSPTQRAPPSRARESVAKSNQIAEHTAAYRGMGNAA